MADGFEAMVDSALAFYGELAQNNTKEWFDPRKDTYTADIRKPAELLSELLAEDLSRISGQPLQPKLFRIHRDVRFSKDKTPYKTHLHMMWKDPGAQAPSPFWYWGLSTDYLIMGAGLGEMKGAVLTGFRNHIDKNGDLITDALDDAETKGITLSDWGPEPLKRVPKPFTADHPHEALLRRKSLTVNGPIASTWRETGLVKASVARARDLLPITQALRF